MPILGRMNKSETQTVFDHSEMKHQIREKDKQDPEIDPRSYHISYPVWHLVRVLESVMVV